MSAVAEIGRPNLGTGNGSWLRAASAPNGATPARTRAPARDSPARNATSMKWPGTLMVELDFGQSAPPPGSAGPLRGPTRRPDSEAWPTWLGADELRSLGWSGGLAPRLEQSDDVSRPRTPPHLLPTPDVRRGYPFGCGRRTRRRVLRRLAVGRISDCRPTFAHWQ